MKQKASNCPSIYTLSRSNLLNIRPLNSAGGPFKEIIQSDIFINCIYLTQPIPPFVTRESLSDTCRKLSCLSDVSCDPNNPHNPVPIYDDWTTFKKPTLPVEVERAPVLTVIAIGESLASVTKFRRSLSLNKGVINLDHLPSLLPKEASGK